jgi:hypothetical protein
MKDCGIDMHPEEVKLMRQALMEMLVKLRINETQEEKQQMIRQMLLKIK